MFLWTKTLESCKARQTAFTWSREIGRYPFQLYNSFKTTDLSQSRQTPCVIWLKHLAVRNKSTVSSICHTGSRSCLTFTTSAKDVHYLTKVYSCIYFQIIWVYVQNMFFFFLNIIISKHIHILTTSLWSVPSIYFCSRAVTEWSKCATMKSEAGSRTRGHISTEPHRAP